MSNKKASVSGLYMEGIRDGHAAAALDRYIGERYTQHSATVGNGKEGFLSFFLPFLERNPDRDIRIVRMIEDGDYVFCSAFQSLNGGQAKWVTMDLFHTNSDDKIIEHWDVIAAFEESLPSGEDMVGGSSEPTTAVGTEQNKKLVLEFTKQVLIEGHSSRIDGFVHEDLIQRSPGILPKRSGLSQAMASGELGQYEMLFKLIGEGDLVMTYSKVYRSGQDNAVFDLYRVDDGKIVEHWGISESILPREEWGNSGKF